MKPGSSTPPPDDEFAPDATDPGAAEPLDRDEPATLPDLSSLPVAGITRRRIGFLGGALISVWIVIVFARQVGAATAATARVEELRDANAALIGQVAALEREAELIQRQEFIEQQARGHRLGSAGEIPFAIGDAPALPVDAPGSASVRLGAEDNGRTPLESWLSLLFGPSR